MCIPQALKYLRRGRQARSAQHDTPRRDGLFEPSRGDFAADSIHQHRPNLFGFVGRHRFVEFRWRVTVLAPKDLERGIGFTREARASLDARQIGGARRERKPRPLCASSVGKAGQNEVAIAEPAPEWTVEAGGLEAKAADKLELRYGKTIEPDVDQRSKCLLGCISGLREAVFTGRGQDVRGAHAGVLVVWRGRPKCFMVVTR